MTFIERRETGAANNEKPFNALQTAKTMKKYSGYWVSVICYIWRTYQLPDAAADMERVADSAGHVELGRNGESAAGYAGERKPRYRLTARQTQALWRVQRVFLPTRRARGGSDEDSHSVNDSEESADELDEEQEIELERHVLAFLISLLDHQLGDDYYKSALVSATAALGVDRDRGWKSPLVYTTVLSGLVTVSKMLVLYSAVQAQKKEIAELRKTGG